MRGTWRKLMRNVFRRYGGNANEQVRGDNETWETLPADGGSAFSLLPPAHNYGRNGGERLVLEANVASSPESGEAKGMVTCFQAVRGEFK